MKTLKALPIALMILGLSLVLRSLFFLRISPNFFEISTYDTVRLTFTEYVLGKEIGLVPPLYYLPARMFAAMGTEPWLPGVFSLIMGLLAPFALYQAAMAAFHDRRIAWGAAVLLAVNPYHVAISCTMTPDSVAVTLICVLLWLFFRTLHGQRSQWLMFSLGALALMHTHAGAPWVLATLFVCHCLQALFIGNNSRSPYPDGHWHRLERVLFYYFVIATLSAPWRIRMDSWVPWHVEYARFGSVLHYLTTVPFYGTNGSHSWISRIFSVGLTGILLASIPNALFLSRRVAAALIGCIMALLACYGYVQIDRTYFLMERDATLIIPFFVLGIIALCAAIPWRKFRMPVFLGFCGFFTLSSLHLPHSGAGSPWREISQVLEKQMGENTVAAFWPNYTSRFVAYELPKMHDRILPMSSVLTNLEESSLDRDVFFVITDSPAESSRAGRNFLFGWPGAIASHSTATLEWRQNNNVIIRAKDVEWPWLRTWTANPVKFALKDLPTPDVTQFLWTPSNLQAPNDPEDDPGTVFNTDGFAWNTPELSFDANGRRVVWTTQPEVSLNLPVTLYPGKYVLRMAASTETRELGNAHNTTRTLQVKMATGNNETSATIESPSILSVPFEVTTETDTLPVRLSATPMLTKNTPNQIPLGIKISSIRVDGINDAAASK